MSNFGNSPTCYVREGGGGDEEAKWEGVRGRVEERVVGTGRAGGGGSEGYVEVGYGRADTGRESTGSEGTRRNIKHQNGHKSGPRAFPRVRI